MSADGVTRILIVDDRHANLAANIPDAERSRRGYSAGAVDFPTDLASAHTVSWFSRVAWGSGPPSGPLRMATISAMIERADSWADAPPRSGRATRRGVQAPPRVPRSAATPWPRSSMSQPVIAATPIP